MFHKVFRYLREIPAVPLGRWKRTDKLKNNLKIDWANVDHCGTCSYLEKKTRNQETPTIEKKKEPKK